jgi:ankyrin repeat protein
MTKLEDSFVECILKNNIKKAKYIIKLKADVTKGEYQGHTPLMAAVVTENIEILEIILDNIKWDDEKVACLTETSFEGYSPFAKAVATGNSEIIERILDSIKDKEKRVILVNKSLSYSRRSAISYARNAETVRVLLKNGADPYLEDNDGFNAFFGMQIREEMSVLER